MLRRCALLLCLLSFPVLAFCQFQPQYDPHKILGDPGHDEEFLGNAMKYTTSDIEWSKIAAQKSANAEVKALANQTIESEMKMASQVVGEANALKVKVPKGTSGKEKKESEKLNGLSGTDFDREYLNAMVKVQHDEVGNLREEMKESRDATLQGFAGSNVDQVAARNAQYQALQKSMGAK